MENRVDNSGNNPVRKISRRSLVAITIVAFAVLLIGVVTSLSMQIGQAQKAKVDEKQLSGRLQIPSPGRRNYIKSNAAGQHVVADRQTGQTRPLTQDEAARLADGLKQLINQSTDDLVKVEAADGTISMDLEGHLQNVTLAKREADGTISESCVDNLQSAADFLEIDPKLLGLNTPLSKGRQAPLTLEDR